MINFSGGDHPSQGRKGSLGGGLRAIRVRGNVRSETEGEGNIVRRGRTESGGEGSLEGNALRVVGQTITSVGASEDALVGGGVSAGRGSPYSAPGPKGMAGSLGAPPG